MLAAAWLCAATPFAGERSQPVDCLPDRLDWSAAGPDPAARFGAANLPGIVLGPPGDSAPVIGSTSVASLGHGGSAVFSWADVVLEDGPGPDFIVFENAFFSGAGPTDPDDDFVVFVEPGIVEVSADGVQWVAFPYDAAALAAASGVSGVDRALYLDLRGLAGLTPTLTGDWTVPDDPEVWDPAGTNGISGAGGDAFDLATVGLSEARFVRITDADSRNGFPGAGDGFDLDAVVVLNGRPTTPAAVDGDGDGLSDAAEVALYGTDPAMNDSDFDGVDDGREVAACRDANSALAGPAHLAEPRLWLSDAACTEARWTFLGSSESYALLRGDLALLFSDAGGVDLGNTTCLYQGPAAVRYSCDATQPVAGQGFFYVVRTANREQYGWSSDLEPRDTSSDCP